MKIHQLNKYKIGLLLVCVMFMIVFAPICAEAAESTYQVNTSGVYHYDKAQEVLQLVNQTRSLQGLSSLSMDKSLTDAAMQRAAECAVQFDHIRPDGSSCSSIQTVIPIYGENIAAGSSTAEDTFQNWMNSSGHKANILGAAYRSIGIGCFSKGDTFYWVQLFSGSNPANQDERTQVSSITATICILDSDEYPLSFNRNGYQDEDTILNVGEEKQFPVWIENSRWSGVHCTFNADSFLWNSSDSQIATVSADGIIHPIAVGETVITATPKSGNAKSASLQIKVRKNISDITIPSIPDVYYDGTVQKPSIILKDGEQTLQENLDYSLTYWDNDKAGSATITIKGMGNYTGTTHTTFSILKKDISELASYDVPEFDLTKYSSQWACVENQLRIFYNGKQLQCNRDYFIASVSMNQNKICGCTVEFYGNYEGSKIIQLSQVTEPDDQTPEEEKNPTDNNPVDTKPVDDETVTKKTQSISSIASCRKAYGTKAFSIKAVSSIGQALSFQSSNPKVATVSKTGVVSIKGTGKTIITITAPGNSTFQSAVRKITLQVVPKKMALSSVKSTKKKQIAVKWKADRRADGYQIVYALKSNFKNAKTITVAGGRKASATIKKLGSKKKYYVKIRAYRIIDKKKCYGTYSKIKKVTVK